MCGHHRRRSVSASVADGEEADDADNADDADDADDAEDADNASQGILISVIRGACTAVGPRVSLIFCVAGEVRSRQGPVLSNVARVTDKFPPTPRPFKRCLFCLQHCTSPVSAPFVSFCPVPHEPSEALPATVRRRLSVPFLVFWVRRDRCAHRTLVAGPLQGQSRRPRKLRFVLPKCRAAGRHKLHVIT